MVSSKTTQHLFLTAATVGILGWMFLLCLLGWWMLQPTNLPKVTEPLPILNANHEVSIGENLYVKLDIEKQVPLIPTDSSRYLACDSGALIALTSTPTRLPVGSYSLVTEDVIIPARMLAGDTCVFEMSITYQINPVRTENLVLTSDVFTIV